MVRLAGTVLYIGEGLVEQGVSVYVASGATFSDAPMWHLDGGTVQDAAQEFGGLRVNPPMESVQEIKVLANGHPAEFGRTGNGQILMTTRAGTNEFHGSVYDFFSHDSLSAKFFFSPEKSRFSDNVGGGSIGGPLAKNRTFVFANYQGVRRRFDGGEANIEVPYSAEIEGNFSARRDLTVRDPLSGEPFENNIIPESRIDPVGRAFARLYPAPNSANEDPTRAPADNFTGSILDRENLDQLTVRIDHVFGGSDRAYGRFSHARGFRDRGSLFEETVADSRASSTRNRVTNAMIAWTHQSSPSTLHELRYTLGDRRLRTDGGGAESGINGKIGLPGVRTESVARISVPGHLSLGNGSQVTQVPISTHQLIHHTSWVQGKHNLKAGLEFRYSEDVVENNGTAGGFFSFSPLPTGSSVATLLLGWTTTGFVDDFDVRHTRSDYWAGFLQDDWKLTRNLTMNIGLRWDMDTPRWDRNNRQNGFDPDALNPVSGTPGVVTFAGIDGRGKFAHDFDLNNFGPRFGFAYRMRPTFVLRGAYGVNFNRAYYSPTSFGPAAGFNASTSLISPDGGFTPAVPFNQGLPTPLREELGPGFRSVPLGARPRGGVSFLEQDRPTPYVQHWNLTLQKQLRRSMLIEAGYIASVGHKLDGPSSALNVVPLVDGRGPETQSQALRPFPQFAGVSVAAAPWGNSSYHDLNLKLEKRYSEGLSLLTNYTWSKSLDDSAATHRERRHLDKSLSETNLPHSFRLSSVYELPFGEGRRVGIGNSFLRALGGGWGIGAAVRIRSGRPLGAFRELVNRTNTFASGMDPKSETVKEGTKDQGTVRRFDCLEGDSQKNSSWRPSGGWKPASRFRP